MGFEQYNMSKLGELCPYIKSSSIYKHVDTYMIKRPDENA